MSTDMLHPTGPHTSLATPTVYRVPKGAVPRRVWRDADGVLCGEVRLEISAVATTRRTRRTAPAPLDLEGYDQRPDPLMTDTAPEFVAAMQRLRIWAGEPSYREMERRCGGVCSSSTFCKALQTTTLPSFPLLAAFLTACGCGDDRERWASAWRRIRFADEGAVTPGVVVEVEFSAVQ